MNTGIFSSKNLIGSGIFLIVLILLATLPQYGPVYSIILLTSILMYIILTISWTIFSGSTGYISLATAAFFGIGMYTSAMLGMNFPLPVVVIIGRKLR